MINLNDTIDNDLIKWLPIGVILLEVNNYQIKTRCLNNFALNLLEHDNLIKTIYYEDMNQFKEKVIIASKDYATFEVTFRIHKNNALSWIKLIGNCLSYHNSGSTYLAIISDISQFKALEQNLRIQAEIYQLIINQSNLIVWQYEHHNNQLAISPHKKIPQEILQIFSNLPDSLLSSNIITPESIDALNHLYQQLIAGVKEFQTKIKINTLQSNEIWVLVKFTNIFNEYRQPLKAIGIVQNIDEQVKLESRYQWEVKYRQKLMEPAIIHLEVDLTTNEIIKSSYNDESLHQNNKYSAVITNLNKLVMIDNQDKFINTFSYKNVLDYYQNQKDDLQMSFLYYRKSKRKYVWVVGKMMFLFNDEIQHLIGFFYMQDIDEAKRKTLELARQAKTDVLTGLLNRRELERIVTHEISQEGALGALFMIDIDNFKDVNDQNGHEAGDRTLRYIAQKIKNLFRSNDVVGRFGGDEFMVYMQAVKNSNDVLIKAQQLSKALIISELNLSITVTCSIGVAFVDEPNMSFDKLYHHADLAAYKAKSSGKNGYQVYNKSA